MEEFLTFFLVGAAAQAVDGALGMGYGVICSSVLLALGVPPATASASVHASKIFTGLASAGSHIWHKNVDWKLFRGLAIGGVIGGVFGAYVLTGIDSKVIKPFVLAWLALMGVVILYRAWKGAAPKAQFMKHAAPVGVAGGFLDAMGGGGWGPTVTTSLVSSGLQPRYCVGTTNAAELVVAVTVSTAFLGALLTGHWENADSIDQYFAQVAGLVLGGVVMAPFAGWMTKLMPTKGLTWAVGCLIVGLAAFQSLQVFGVM